MAPSPGGDIRVRVLLRGDRALHFRTGGTCLCTGPQCGMMQLLTSANWQVGDFKIWFNCNLRCSAKISTNPVCPMHKNK
jgi:hypothetical protein